MRQATPEEVQAFLIPEPIDIPEDYDGCRVTLWPYLEDEQPNGEHIVMHDRVRFKHPEHPDEEMFGYAIAIKNGEVLVADWAYIYSDDFDYLIVPRNEVTIIPDEVR